ncbi:hypothetical protein HDU85_005014 [Gaertneriomyces sp. JEL0708]|nr:hypothetical protein HDU85_005014 [Gaertneriomyces sp. JEL0708]
MGAQSSKAARRFPTRPSSLPTASVRPGAGSLPTPTPAHNVFPDSVSSAEAAEIAETQDIARKWNQGKVGHVEDLNMNDTRHAEATPSSSSSTSLPLSPAEDSMEKEWKKEREQHARLLEHYQQMQFETQRQVGPEDHHQAGYRKDNPLLTILSKRSRTQANESLSQASYTNLPTADQKLPIQSLARLYDLRKTRNLSSDELASMFSLGEKDVNILLRYWNAPEIVLREGGGSLEGKGVWVDDARKR